MILPVFVLSVGQLLDITLGFSEVLLGITKPPVLTPALGYESPSLRSPSYRLSGHSAQRRPLGLGRLSPEPLGASCPSLWPWSSPVQLSARQPALQHPPWLSEPFLPTYGPRLPSRPNHDQECSSPAHS